MSGDSAGGGESAELVFPPKAEAHSQVDRHTRTGPPHRPAPIGHGRAMLVIATSLGSLTLAALAAFNDARAFIAAATPSLYGSLFLLVILLAGGLLMVHAGWEGIQVPWHFPVALGVATTILALLTVPVAIRVASKDEAEKPSVVAKAHVDLRNRTLSDKSFVGQNMRLANFSGASLSHVDLGGVDLSEADLRDVELRDVNLSGVNLCGTDLRGADLRGARGLDSVVDWSYAFYDRRTRLPKSLSYLLHTHEGPIPDTGRDLLYMCASNVTRRIES